MPLRPLQAKPFFFATTKNRIGRGPRRCYGHCRRNHSSLPLRKLESVAEVRCRDGRCRRAIPHCCDDGAAVIPKLTPSNQESLQCKMRFQAKAASIRKSVYEIKNRCSLWAVSGENLASIRKSGPEIKNRCTKDGGNREIPASIRKFGLEIKNRCTKEGVIGEKLTSIPKSGLEIKNRCTKDGLNRQNLASIHKSGLEIKNRCTKQPIFTTRPQHIPQHAFITR